MPINLKYVTFLAAVVVSAGSVNFALADQKHDNQVQDDKQMQRAPVIAQGNDTDLLTQVRLQNGTPKMKRDLYVVRNPGSAANCNLVRENQAQKGGLRSKTDQVCNLCPLK
jgi:hypothetical protein